MAGLCCYRGDLASRRCAGTPGVGGLDWDLQLLPPVMVSAPPAMPIEPGRLDLAFFTPTAGAVCALGEAAPKHVRVSLLCDPLLDFRVHPVRDGNDWVVR